MAQNRRIDEIEAVFRKFGDEQSTLLDQFERISFEVQLNQAILSRSLSDPAKGRSKPESKLPAPLVTQEVRQGRRGSGFGKVLKKLLNLKPIFRRRGNNGKINGERKEEISGDPRNLKNWKAFSRSLRV